MAKKRKDSEYWIKFYEPIYPNIRLLATERFSGGWKNLYNAKTHQPRLPVRDHGEAGAVLIVVEKMAEENGRTVQFGRDERKRLDAIGLLLSEENHST
jgi:hypothetical protein